MRAVKTTLIAIALVAQCALSQPNFQMPYNGGNKFNFSHNNPFYFNQLLNSVGSGNAACEEIPGVGLPILALKKFLIAVDLHLDDTNINTFVKIIFLKETKTHTGINVRMVVVFKTFSDTFYAGVEGELRLKGTQTFRLTSYHYDTDLTAIKEVIGEPNIDVNNFIGCGNLKEIYSNFLKNAKKPEFLAYNVPYGQAALPLTMPYNNNQPPTFGLNNGSQPNGASRFGPFAYNFGGR